MSFKRSPSKVWWGSESLEYREVSSSPGSQDSGFSDTETSPHNRETAGNEKPSNAPHQIPKGIFKESSGSEKLNLSSNYREKLSPVKENIDQRLVRSERKNSPHVSKKFSTAPNTEPAKRQRYVKHSPKVSRNLFVDASATINVQECSDDLAHQYSRPVTKESNGSGGRETTKYENSRLPKHDASSTNDSEYSDTTSEISSTKSLPVIGKKSKVVTTSAELNLTAPAVLETAENDDSEAVTSFNSFSSDCESELERLFDNLGEPEHTSTPKADLNGCKDMRHRRDHRRLHQRLALRYRDDQRVPPIHAEGIVVDNKAVQRWLEEARTVEEQECTITLQCKSIAAELNQKTSHLAACVTTILRGMLSHSRCIEMEYRNLNNETKQINPLVQSLAGNILDFLKTYSSRVSSDILTLHDEIRTLNSDRVLEPMAQLFNKWETVQNQILVKEVKKLVDKIEDPASEMDLRATLTGIISVALRNTDLVVHFVKADIIPILLILCEKCEGSSIRAIILRALSTMCSHSSAVRHFEKFSGVQIIADTIEEDSRPEPERSEAVGLLAQITAPWLEDNHSVKGLQEYSRKLVRSLTKFASSTKCCQNLLLCAAALANLSSMDTNCVKYLLQYEVASVLLKCVKSRGPLVSIYLLEQVATLLANMAAVEVAREHLSQAEAPSALLHFLRAPRIRHNEEVERRLQQKSVIALSRLCGHKRAAEEFVECGGVSRLVELCRERDERFDSDAVLVAALATLRKIAEVCGADVLSVQDSQELVEPKLLDSFLAYSTQNESYV
ncbi:protein inscuteable homolog [Cylas formicarius]|uniref:protein inscuteable homolog n=1 Tax=Cylas formicarius TaxID=197179 RepID=UPI002958DEEA|nr:protein inscuteable homolog [Cylas formicarius]XP_060527065.1 protein inscuteable homolog [Cylas formicarius]